MQERQSYTTLYIIGNGFDLMHEMDTRYSDLKIWLCRHTKIDVIQELEDVFGNDSTAEYLWSDFEAALGTYDVEKVANWDLSKLYIAELSIGKYIFIYGDNAYADSSLKSIIKRHFTSWVRSIELAKVSKINLNNNALFFSFNYTETLENLYCIPTSHVLHIHGHRRNEEEIIVGHNTYIDPVRVCVKGNDVRANNERFQNICDMNGLCKPIEDNLKKYQPFWDELRYINRVIIIGHSCNELDMPYYKKIVSSIPKNAEWVFHYYSTDDKYRILNLTQQLGISKYIMKETNCLFETTD